MLGSHTAIRICMGTKTQENTLQLANKAEQGPTFISCGPATVRPGKILLQETLAHYIRRYLKECLAAGFGNSRKLGVTQTSMKGNLDEKRMTDYTEEYAAGLQASALRLPPLMGLNLKRSTEQKKQTPDFAVCTLHVFTRYDDAICTKFRRRRLN